MKNGRLEGTGVGRGTRRTPPDSFPISSRYLTISSSVKEVKEVGEIPTFPPTNRELARNWLQGRSRDPSAAREEEEEEEEERRRARKERTRPMGCLVRITEERRPWGLAGRQAGRVEESEEEEDASRVGGREDGGCRRAAGGCLAKGACAFPWTPCIYAPSSAKRRVYIPFQRTGPPFSHSISFCHRSFSAPCCPLSTPPRPESSAPFSFFFPFVSSPPSPSHHQISYAYPNDDAAIEIRVVDALAFRRVSPRILPSRTFQRAASSSFLFPSRRSLTQLNRLL